MYRCKRGLDWIRLGLFVCGDVLRISSDFIKFLVAAVALRIRLRKF
jgi:hypothetical protein